MATSGTKRGRCTLQTQDLELGSKNHQNQTLLDVSGYLQKQLMLKAILFASKLYWYLEDFLRFRDLTIMRLSLPHLNSLLSVSYLPLLHI